ncbi:MAG: hypothetical protein ACE5G2_06820, partial [Candidatus Krumholzibacteriia bacterium]
MATAIAVPVLAVFTFMSATSTANVALDDPVRALAIVSDARRRLVESRAAGWIPYLLLDDAGDVREQVERDWQALIDELRREAPKKAPTAALVRDVVLAAWGDDEASARAAAEAGSARHLLPPELAQPPESTPSAAVALGVAVGLVVSAAMLAGIVIPVIWLVRRAPPSGSRTGRSWDDSVSAAPTRSSSG